MMKVIGICGSSGSGKSTVCAILHRRGIPVLDCDVIYHKLVDAPSDCLREIGESFGNELVSSGRLDRKRLGSIVFSDREKMKLLNSISHRHVKNELEKQIEICRREGNFACVIDAPMFFEAGLEEKCDLVCAVIADPKLQIERVCERDGISHDEALNRISNQILPLELRAKADFVIENRGDISYLETCCDELIRKINTLKG